MAALRHGLFAALILFAGTLAVLADPVFPQLTGRVVDDADLLSATQESDLTARLAALENKTTDQLVIVTLPSLQGWTIEEFGYRLGRHWAIGQKDKNNGVLLIVAPNERKVRIEVGYGLEGVLTDALSRVIIDTSILPAFRKGDMAGGIIAGAGDIITVLSGEAEQVSQRLASRPNQTGDLLAAIFIFLFVLVVILIIFSMIRGMTGSGRGGRWSSSSSGGSWGSSGGGFSGGGGSFGGGGSSGSW